MIWCDFSRNKIFGKKKCLAGEHNGITFRIIFALTMVDLCCTGALADVTSAASHSGRPNSEGGRAFVADVDVDGRVMVCYVVNKKISKDVSICRMKTAVMHPCAPRLCDVGYI